MENLSLRYEERIVFELRDLFQKYGYLPFKMSKFEDYDLYARNKDFLISDNIITFTDTNGKLKALKPDVTLSIVRNGRDTEKGVQKVYYNENVYRVSKSSRTFREIMQTGVECIGEVDDYCIAETLMLAAESILTVSKDCILDLSHLDIVANAVNALGVAGDCQQEILKCIGEKNLHGISELCSTAGADTEATSQLIRLVQTAGTPKEVFPLLRKMPCCEGALDQLEKLVASLKAVGLADVIRIDFSVVNDMNYYNGIVFKGFVSGVPNGVISGGQYDKLMQKMGRKASAIGFAVYLDMLERFSGEAEAFDVDIVLLYDDSVSTTELIQTVKELSENGERVMAQRSVPEKIRFRKLATFCDGEVTTLEHIS